LLLVHHLIALHGVCGADADNDVDAGLEQSVCQMRRGRKIAVFRRKRREFEVGRILPGAGNAGDRQELRAKNSTRRLGPVIRQPIRLEQISIAGA
jgi:hypothetical protein